MSYLQSHISIKEDIESKTKSFQNKSREPITIHYNKEGLERKIVYPNGLEELYRFNEAKQLIVIKTANQVLSYEYDKVGNISKKGSKHYSYDAIGRLTKVNQQHFSYDKAGNRKDKHNKYDTRTNQLLENEHYFFSYDKRGNLKSKINKVNKESTYYRFNLLNQLIEVKRCNEQQRIIKQFNYEYDALNRRVMRQEDYTKHYYLYDGLNIIAILDRNKKPLATIVHHDTKIDTPLSITTLYGTFYYHRDHQGSIIALSNEHGDIVEKIKYDDHYGMITQHWKQKDVQTLNPYGYTGREIEQRDLYYYRARYYDPTTQRFLSPDPIGFLAGDFNFYRYVGNSPVSFRDPLGLEADGGFLDTVGGFLSDAGSSIWDFGGTVVDAFNPFGPAIDVNDIVEENINCNDKVNAIVCPQNTINAPSQYDQCKLKKINLSKKCLYDTYNDSVQLGVEEIIGAPKKGVGKAADILYNNTVDKNIYETSESNKSIEQAIKDENISYDYSNITTIDNVTNQSSPIKVIDTGTCYENIIDTNTSDILKQDVLCDEEAKTYDYTIEPD